MEDEGFDPDVILYYLRVIFRELHKSRIIEIHPSSDRIGLSDDYRVKYDVDEIHHEHPLARGFQIYVLYNPDPAKSKFVFEYLDNDGNSNDKEEISVQDFDRLEDKIRIALTFESILYGLEKDIQDVLNEKQLEKVILTIATDNQHEASDTYRVLYNEDEYCLQYPLARGFETCILYNNVNGEIIEYYFFEYIDAEGKYIHDDLKDNFQAQFPLDGNEELLKQKLREALTLSSNQMLPDSQLQWTTLSKLLDCVIQM